MIDDIKAALQIAGTICVLICIVAAVWVAFTMHWLTGIATIGFFALLASDA